jgi:hypothetical protein
MSDDSPQARFDSLKAQYDRKASVCWVSPCFAPGSRAAAVTCSRSSDFPSAALRKSTRR